MHSGGYFNLKAGEFTDDTSLALCLAESLIKCNGLDLKDNMDMYWKWLSEGYLSVNDKAIGVGKTTMRAIFNYTKTGNPISKIKNKMSAGNGSLMRLAPVPLFYSNNPIKAIEKSGESSKTNHPLQITVDACRYFGGLIYGATNGVNKELLLSKLYAPIDDYWIINDLHPEITEIANGSFKEKKPPEIKGTGYISNSLESALWAFYNSNSYEEGIFLAVNLGNDADTTGAIYGQLAGAYYRFNEIPLKFKNKIAMKDLLNSIAEKLNRKLEI